MVQNIDAVLTRGQQFEDNEEYDKAYFLYTEMLKQFPQSVDLVLRAAHLAELQGNFDEAIKHWEYALVLNPTDSGAYSKLADLYYNINKFKHYMTKALLKVTEGKHSHAIGNLKKAIDNANDDKEILEATFKLAQMYELSGKREQAIEEYTKMLNLEDNVNVYFKLGELYEKDNINVAISTLKTGVEKFPDSQMLKEKLALMLTKNNKIDDAVEFAQSHDTKAKAYLLKGELEKALAEINAIGVKTESYFSLLAEYYFNTKEYDECLETIANLEKINALNPLPYQMKALVYEEKNDNLSACCNWGKCYLLQGKNEMALSEYLQAHSIEPTNAIVICEIINLYENMNEKYPALEFAQKLLKLEPENVLVMKKIAKHAISEGNLTEGIEHLEKVAEISVHDWATFGELAKLYNKRKNYENELKYWEKYLIKAPVNDDTPRVKARIDELRNMDLAKMSAPEQEEVGFIDKIIDFWGKFKRN